MSHFSDFPFLNEGDLKLASTFFPSVGSFFPERVAAPPDFYDFPLSFREGNSPLEEAFFPLPYFAAPSSSFELPS